MNLHLPRSYQTQVELEEIAAVPKQVVSPQASKPVMGLVQDSMLACFRWTMSENYLNARQVMKLMAWTSTYDGFLPEPEDPKQGWQAHSVLSTVLPKFTYIHKDEEKVKNCKIVHGKFEEGVWSSKSVGGKISNLVHAVWKDYGSETTRLFMDNMMNLTMQWLLIDGFSIGIKDTNIDDVTTTKVKEIINSVYGKVTKKISELREGKFEVKFSNVGLQEQFENEMFELVNGVRNEAQSTTYKSLDNNNRIYATVTSGSKGSPANVVQISSLLGQQALEGGKRIHGGYSHRTLPHYAKYDMRPESRGFIQNNYINGLNPAEWFMHAMSGREGVISTAIKTAITGYTQRKLIKVMEDLKVYYDNTVRNANNFVISHVYGTDGFDASKLEKATLKYFTVDPESAKFNQEFKWTDKGLKEQLSKEAYQDWMLDTKSNFGEKHLQEEFEQIKEDRQVLRDQMYPHWSEHGPIYTPINFPRILDWVKYHCGLHQREQGDVSPLEIIQKVRALIQDIRVSQDPVVSSVCTRHFRFLIRYWLHSKRLISQYKFNRPALDLLLLKVKEHYHDSLINPGEMVGIIAAQSIGEPLTQITLNSVAPHERLILQNEDGTTQLVKIGEWIDNLLSENPDGIKYFEKNKTEYLELNKCVWTPTPTKEGKFGWDKITAITRHLPGGDLVKITTRGGRTVTATKSKSVLVWKDGELVQIGGGDAVVGDLVPVICDFPEPNVIVDYLDLRKYLSPKEWTYGTELLKLYRDWNEDTRPRRSGFWTPERLVNLPHSRGDSAIESARLGIVKEGIVYPKANIHAVKSLIPEKFPLDKDFGTIVGLYLAEGWATNTFVGISNNDPTIMTIIQNWCDKYGMTHHIVVTESKRFENSKSTDFKIHSVLLARWFKVWLGTGSANKQMPPEAFTSNLEFVRGILDGYFAGDGTVNKRDGFLCISSVSEDLITGFGVLCSRFGIMGKKSGHQPTKNNVDSKNIKYAHTYSIRNSFAVKWVEEIGSCHPEKNSLMKSVIMKTNYTKPFGNYWKKVNSTILDPIVSIEEVPATEFVYDLTVPATTNFSIWNGLGVADTFHQSGLGARSKKLSEVPRLREIFSTTANQKTPFVNIYLMPNALRITETTSHEEVIRRGEDMLDLIQYTTLNSLIKGYQILFDPNERNTIVEKDRKWLKRAHEIMGYEDIETPWLIRLVFNSEKIQNLSLQDIKTKLEEDVSTDDVGLFVLHNPQNSQEVVMRIRVATRSDDPKKDLKDIMKKILTTPVKGIPNIMGGSLMYEDKDLYLEDGRFVSKESSDYEKNFKYKNKENKTLNPLYQQYLIQTEGTNLFDVLALDGIETYRSYTNDLHECLDVLGIEAVRELIIQEIVKVFAFGGTSLNNRHLGVLADVMTAQGQLVSTDRYGINKLNTGVLSKATFETTTNQIANASMFGEEDPMKGVSAKIMFGEFFEGGTNAFNVMLDEEMIMDNADKLYYPKKMVKPKNVEYAEEETLASCQNLDFEFAL